jgi:ribosomal protein S18 acetylase RimI-like enzyme
VNDLRIAIEIKPLNFGETVPYDLLLLADPSRALVDVYVSRGQLYIAYHEAEVIGVVVLISTHPQTIEIVNIAVRESFQGKGVGRRLINRAIEEAKLMQAHAIEIGTGNSSFKQLLIYQKCGFRIVGIDHDFFVRNYEEEIYEDGIQCRDMIRLRMSL